MKKLMIAAAVAAMTAGAFATCEEGVKCPFGYQIKVLVKTTTTANYTAYDTAACDDSNYCLRVPATRRFAGFIYGTTGDPVTATVDCEEVGSCNCNEWVDAATIALWDYDTKKDAKVEAWTLLQLDRILNENFDTTTFEIAFDLGFGDPSLRFAGFGKVAKKDGKWTIKNASGFCAGQLPQGICKFCKYNKEECEDDCTDVNVLVWGICDDESAPTDDTYATKTVAYGKWTLDWSETVKNRFEKGEPVDQAASDWEKVESPVVLGE